MRTASKYRLSERAVFTADIKNTNDAERLREFAGYYFQLGNFQEAALALGITPAKAFSEGEKLIHEPEVRRHLKRLGRNGGRAEALAGLRRLAFGRINDALTLLREDGCEADTSALDLFNVSEIKKVKGGGVEVKFFDRLEALKTLAELEDKAADTAAADSFFSALKKTARGAGREDVEL